MFYWIEKADSSFFLTSLTSKGSAKPNPEGRNQSLSFLWIEAVIEAKAFAIPEGSPCWLNVCYSSRKCEFGPRIERKVKERGEWCFVSSSRSRVGIHENREVSYGFRTGRSEKSWNESPATRGAILRLYYINSLSGFSGARRGIWDKEDRKWSCSADEFPVHVFLFSKALPVSPRRRAKIERLVTAMKGGVRVYLSWASGISIRVICLASKRKE